MTPTKKQKSLRILGIFESTFCLKTFFGDEPAKSCFTIILFIY